MIADWTTIEVLTVLFLATFVRSAFGFGEALIAVPLLALIMPMNVAAPVAVLISITVAVIVLAQDWRHVHARSAGWLVLSTLVGTPLGLLLLTRVEGRIVKGCLGIFIVAFSVYSLLDRRRLTLEDDTWAWTFGFGAGVLGGAYGMNGPPLVMYGALRGWSPQRFRATLQGYFLPASLMSLAGYWLAGLWKPIVTHYYLISLPAVLAAIFLGRAFSGRMDERSFLRYIHGDFIVCCCYALMGCNAIGASSKNYADSRPLSARAVRKISKKRTTASRSLCGSLASSRRVSLSTPSYMPAILRMRAGWLAPTSKLRRSSELGSRRT